MKKRIAINGFGRIGRLCFRIFHQMNDVEVVAINDLTSIDALAQLLKYDSAHGRFNGSISTDDDQLIVNGQRIHTYSERDPELLPWNKLDIDLVLECTGVFTTRPAATKHLTAGAKKVLISAPAKSDDIKTIVLGVNDDMISNRETIYSNASCTTNCLAPMAKIVHENWGIAQANMTTVHAYTADQNLQDGPHRDLRRARAAAFNSVPTSTGAAKATAKVIPELQGKMSAMAIRVPVITGSIVDFNVIIEKETTRDEINETFKSYSENQMKGILEYSEDPLVSSDIVGNPYSCIFDSQLTQVDGRFIKLIAWYDNEFGYASRLSELAQKLA